MSDRTVLITGASKGIGLAIANKIAQRGGKPIGIARHASNTAFPGELIACDLSDIEQTENVLADLARRFEITSIVNNVGVASPQPIGGIGLETLQTVFDLNVRVAVQVTQCFLETMKKRGHGRIVNICSRAIFGARDRTAYSAAKSALVGCTRTWALELAEYGITSNAIAPGPVETDMFRKTRPVGGEAEQQVLSTIPMRRLGHPDEIAAAACFFLSDEAGFITGQVLSVDGGGSIGGR